MGVEPENYRVLYENMPLMYFTLDIEGTILSVNPLGAEQVGYTVEELVGKPILTVIHEEDSKTVQEQFLGILQNVGQVAQFEVRKIRQNGDVLWVQMEAFAKKRNGGGIVIYAAGHAITERKQTMSNGEKRVLERIGKGNPFSNVLKERLIPAMFESFFNHAADAMAVFDLEGHVVQLNPAYEKIFGWTAQEVAGQKLPSIPQNLNHEMEKIYEEVKRGGRIIGLETVRERKDGQMIDVSVTYSPVRDAKGNVVAVSGIARDITDRKQREKEQKRLLAILEGTTDFVATADVHGRVLYYNRTARNMLGIGEEEDISSVTIPDTHPEWAGLLVLNEGLPAAAREGVWSGETAFLSRDGREIPVHQLILAHQSEDGKVEYYSTVARDLTDMKRSQEKERMANKVFESVTEGILVTDANATIVFANPAFTTTTGYSEEEAIGQKPSILRSGRHSPDFYKDMWTSLLETGQWTGEIWNKRKNGEIFVEEISIRTVKDELGKTTHYVGVFKEITLRKQMEEQIQYQAYYDALTGLSNRTFFLDRLTQLIAHARRNQHMFAVMFLDLDRFKFINDTLGHSQGDILLQKVAERLKRCVRESDTVSRFGGDEFIILLADLSSQEGAVKVAEKILEALAQPFVLEGQEYFISASIGISLYPIDGNDEETLFRNADMAMYRAKERGNHYQFFLPSMGVLSLERLKLENDLRKALERKEFFLHYQPKVDLNTGEIIGVEALVRWQHPELGMVSPGKFIPLAEETGLILPLGEWVLRSACRQNKTWQEEGLPPVRVAVNLSMAQFQQKNLTEMIAVTLKETGLSPHFLELEVTESVIMRNLETTIRVFQELKEMGIQISLDDFGTGYSSLSYLKQLPFDALKIDQSFIRDIKTSPDEMSIVRAVIDLAHSLKMKVITEGVETEEQIHVLRFCQCDEIQGYYFSPPVSAEEFKELLQKKCGL